MQIPSRLPGLKWLIVFWGVTAVIWSILEGNLQRVQLFAFLTTLTVLAYLLQRVMGGRRLTRLRGLASMAVWGVTLGAGSVVMTLFLMAVKTGLHAHGPEFTTAEIMYVWRQLSLWSLAGLLAGLGLGLLAVAFAPSRS